MENCENCKFYARSKEYKWRGKTDGKTVYMAHCTHPAERRLICRAYNETRPLKCGHYEDKET